MKEIKLHLTIIGKMPLIGAEVTYYEGNKYYLGTIVDTWIRGFEPTRYKIKIKSVGDSLNDLKPFEPKSIFDILPVFKTEKELLSYKNKNK